jgi:hypothetical protein
MAKRAHPDPKAALDARTAELLSLTATFCDAHLNAEYKELCARLIKKMRRKRAVPFLAGRPSSSCTALSHYDR